MLRIAPALVTRPKNDPNGVIAPPPTLGTSVVPIPVKVGRIGDVLNLPANVQHVAQLGAEAIGF